MNLTEVRAKWREKKLEATIGLLVVLSTPLFLVIWQGWLFGILARTGAAMPRQVLGAMIGILLLWLFASLVLTVLYGRALRIAEAKNKALANLPAELEKANADNRTLAAELSSLEVQRTSASLDMQQALAHLQAFSENVPRNGDIKEELVTEYHNILTRIEKESDHNLGAFRISSNEVAYHETKYPASRRIGSHYTPAHVSRSEHRYCNRELFLTRLHGVVKFLAG